MEYLKESSLNGIVKGKRLQNYRFKNKIIFSIFTGLIFGSMHLISAKSLIEIPFILSYSIAGFALGYVFYDTNNIFTSMFFHFFNNFLSLILTIIGEYL